MRNKGNFRGEFLCLLLGCLLLSASPIRACDAPVFRYALERWSADPYEVIVFHRGPLAPEDRAVVDRLLNDPSSGDFHSNFIFRLVDLSAPMDKATQKLWGARFASELPWMAVRYSNALQIEESVWSGRFSVTAVERLLDSPIRREIARRILDGQCAVWILLESGHREHDDTAADLLSAQLEKMEESLELPVPSNSGVESVEDAQGYPDLWIEFSMVRLSRIVPAEQMLVHMLLHSEWDLGMSSEPMAFPIFGRGRILYALIGDGINEENIREACSFIVGECSCQIKDLSPGTDLLMSVDWEGMLAGQVFVSEEISPIVGLSEFVELMDTTGQNSAGMETAVAEPTKEVPTKESDSDSIPGTLKRNMLMVLLLGFVSVAMVSYILKSRS